MRRLRFSGAGVSSLCGVNAGVNGGVCVGLWEPGSGLPSSESFRLFDRFRVVSFSVIPIDVGIANERSVRSSPPESESRSSSLPVSLVESIVPVVLSEILDLFVPMKFSSQQTLYIVLRRMPN